MPAPAERAELEALRAQQLVCGSEDVGFLRYLAASYVSRGMHQQALQVLQRLTTLSPGETGKGGWPGRCLVWPPRGVDLGCRSLLSS